MSADRPSPRWPLRVTLSILLVIEVVFIIKIIGEGISGGSAVLLVASLGIVLSCVLAWRGTSWARWSIVAFIVLRLAHIGVSMAAHFSPDDHRLPGTLILVAIYVAAGAVVASPLGRPAAGAAR